MRKLLVVVWCIAKATQRYLWWLEGIVTVLILGCQLEPLPQFMEAPLTTQQQIEELQKHLVAGMSREEVMHKLKELGIGGSYGHNTSIYYCDVWQRDRKTLWHINIALLFNDEGKLYKIRPSYDLELTHPTARTEDPPAAPAPQTAPNQQHGVPFSGD